MQKEEVKRIMRLVQEGKLSPDDAAELIEAFEADEEPTPNAKTEPPQPPPVGGQPHTEPFSSFLEGIEKLGREVAQNVNWQDISTHLRTGVQKGTEALKTAAEEVKSGKFSFGIFLAQETKTVTLPLSITDAQILRIENTSGDIRVIGGSQVSEVIAKAHVRGSDSADAKAKADTYSPVIVESDGVVTIEQTDLPHVTVDFEIHLMTQSAVEVKSRSGDIEVSRTGAACRIQTSSGNIRVNGAQNTVEVNVSSGDITIMDSECSSVIIESKSGDLRMLNVSGNMNLRTVSGDLTMERCSGRSISVESISGDVNIDLDKPIEGNTTIRSVQGNTNLTLADNNNCRVTMATLRGSTDCLLDMQDMNRDDKRITGKLGDGAGTLDISAVSGDVRVKQRIHV